MSSIRIPTVLKHAGVPQILIKICHHSCTVHYFSAHQKTHDIDNIKHLKKLIVTVEFAEKIAHLETNMIFGVIRSHQTNKYLTHLKCQTYNFEEIIDVPIAQCNLFALKYST